MTWTAPGDDGTTGQAAGYLVKYSLNPIATETDFNAANTFTQSWAPASSGLTETKTITGLLCRTAYYFSIKAYDELGQYPDFSIGAASGAVSGTFYTAQNLTGLQSSSLAWGDYDNDGHPDLIVCGTTDGGTTIKTTLYHNDGTVLTDSGKVFANVFGGGAAEF